MRIHNWNIWSELKEQERLLWSSDIKPKSDIGRSNQGEKSRRVNWEREQTMWSPKPKGPHWNTGVRGARQEGTRSFRLPMALISSRSLRVLREVDSCQRIWRGEWYDWIPQLKITFQIHVENKLEGGKSSYEKIREETIISQEQTVTSLIVPASI